MGFLSIFLFFIGFFSFLKKQKHITLVVIILLSTSYFNFAVNYFLLGPISLQHGDLALLLIFILILVRNKQSDKQLKGIKKALNLFFIFLIISISYDFLVRGTSLLQIFRTTREIGYLMFFFLINSFSWRDYQRLYHFLVVITTFHAILYISQYVFNYSYTPYADSLRVSITNELGGSRYTNGPYYIIPIFVILVFLYSKQKKKYGLQLIMFFISILLAQSRGNITSAIFIIFLYFYIENKISIGTLLLTPFFAFLGYNLILYIFPVITVRFSSLTSDFSLINSIDYNNLETLRHKGSLLFRYGLSYERFMYVINDPIKILLGVGFVPDIDILEPIFSLGTHSPLLPTGFEQYNTADVFFPNIITRFGILGSILFINIIIKLMNFGFKNKKLFWGKILFTYIISLLIISFSSNTFYNEQIFLMIFIFAASILFEKHQISQ